MVINVNAKGARTEITIRDILRKHTGLSFERVPSSGALDPKHQLKGDLYLVGVNNKYCIECKGYAEDHLTSKLLTDKTPQLVTFWEQTVRQAKQVGKKPLLMFKFDRSKVFVAFEAMPNYDYRYFYVNLSLLGYEFYVAPLEAWLEAEKPGFI